MRLSIFKIILLILLPACGFAQIKLETRSLLDNEIELLVPTYFKPMSEAVIAQKYPNPG